MQRAFVNLFRIIIRLHEKYPELKEVMLRCIEHQSRLDNTTLQLFAERTAAGLYLMLQFSGCEFLMDVPNNWTAFLSLLNRLV